MPENFKGENLDIPEVEDNNLKWEKAGFISESQARDAIEFLEVPLVEHLKERNSEEVEWSDLILSKAKEGKPNEVTIIDINDDRLGRKKKQLVYCDKQGKPVAVANLIKYRDFVGGEEKWGVTTIATDKSRGLLSARAAKYIFDEIFKLDAFNSIGTISPDAIRFAYKYLTDRVAQLPPEMYRILGGKKGQPIKKSFSQKKKELPRDTFNITDAGGDKNE